MALLRIPDQGKTHEDAEEITRILCEIGISYRQLPTRELPPEASQADTLEAYSAEIDALKTDGGYVSADVINVDTLTPGLDEMLNRFNKEHWHDEDEVRFIVGGRGVFHIAPKSGQVVGIEVEAGDMISVPKGTLHWFDLCADRNIRAIRLFQDASGWTPHYTESGTDSRYDQVCFGPAYFPPQI